MKKEYNILVLITLFTLFSCGTAERTAYSPSKSYYERTRDSTDVNNKYISRKTQNDGYRNKWISYQDDEVTEYSCPYCGSRDVMEIVSKRGFSAGKALAGGLIFGPIGLLAGASGQNKIQITLKCRRCGKSGEL